jgi:glucose/arabinose dehydrogenase
MAIRILAGLRARILRYVVLFALPVALHSIAYAQSLEAVQIGTFSSPVYVTGAPGSPDLLFVVERAGAVRVMVNEVKRAQPFLDIRDLVRGLPDTSAGGEEGLLSIAFPPNYAQSGRFYVAFTNNAGNVEINEFRRSATNRLVASRPSRRPLLTVSHPEARNHNGGQLQFAGDGLLYISIGDGGRSPPGDLARNIWSRLGKILRINPLPSGMGAAFTIPASNPFVGKPGNDLIFAYGLRNPWRFAIDAGRIIIGDVGQQRREEVDFLSLSTASGANFGWPRFEGNLSFDPTRPGPHRPKPPIHTYSHDSGGCAIIGGYIMRDPRIPALANRYLYGDACTGVVRSFVPNVPAQTVANDASTGLTLAGLSSFGRGANNRLYATQLGGPVVRLDPP